MELKSECGLWLKIILNLGLQNSHGSSKFVMEQQRHRNSRRSTWRASLTTKGERFCSQIRGKSKRLSHQSSGCPKRSYWIQILHTCLQLLREDWADLAKIILRNMVSIVSWSAMKCIESFPCPLLLSLPLDNGVVARKNWTPALCESQQHLVRDMIPSSLWTILFSRRTSFRNLDSCSLTNFLLKCWTFSSRWDLWNSWWNFDYPANSFPWMSLHYRRSHTHSPNFWKFFSWVCNVRHSCLLRTWSFTLFTAPSWELTLSSFSDPSWIISPYLTDCAFPSGRGSSWWGRTCCIASQEVFSGFLDRSCVAAPLFHLRRLRSTKILFLITCWRESIRLPWSIVYRNRLIHHRSRFGCDTFFSWFLLSSFCHCSSASCRAEIAQQMIPLIACEIPFG